MSSKVRQLRKSAGLTQEEAAQECDIPLRTFADYDRGQTTPPSDRMEHIRRVLGGEKREIDVTGNGSYHSHIEKIPTSQDDSVVIDQRLIQLQDYDEATHTAHKVSGALMGQWMSDDAWVIATHQESVDVGGRYVARIAGGRRKAVTQLYRWSEDQLLQRTYAPMEETILTHLEGDVYERENDSTVTLQILGRVVWPCDSPRQHAQGVADHIGRALENLHGGGGE